MRGDDAQRSTEVCVVVENEFAKLKEWLEARLQRQEDLLMRLRKNSLEPESEASEVVAKSQKASEVVLSPKSKGITKVKPCSPSQKPQVTRPTTPSQDPQTLRITADTADELKDNKSETSIEELPVLPGMPEDETSGTLEPASPQQQARRAVKKPKKQKQQEVEVSGRESVEGRSSQKRRQSQAGTHTKDWQSQLMSAFDQMDLDRSGSIDRSEFTEAFQEVGLPAVQAFDVFKVMDESGNKAIDRSEWLHIIEQAANSDSEEISVLMDFVERLSARQKKKGHIYDTAHVRKHRFLIRHDSLYRMGWDLMLTVLLFYISMSVPYSLGFGQSEAGEQLDRVLDMIFCIDVCLNFRTTYLDRDETLIMDGCLIARNYLKTWFLLDFSSSVPFDLLTSGLLPSFTPARLLKIGKIAKVLKLLRISKMQKTFSGSEFFEKLEEKSTQKETQRILKLSKLIIIAFILGHWLACFGAAVDSTMLDSYLESKMDEPTGGQKYLAAMYWALVTLSTVGYGDITPQSDEERLYAMFAMVVGSAFYGYIIGSVTSIVSDIDTNQRTFYDRMDLIQCWLSSHTNIPPLVRRRIRKHFSHKLAEKSAMEDGAVVLELSPELRADATYFILHEHVRHNPMFYDISNSALSNIVEILEKNFTNAGEFLVKSGDPGIAMYILVSGSARYDKGFPYRGHGFTTPETRFQKLEEGDSFGEEIIFSLEETYMYTIIAITDCEFHYISEDGFKGRYENMPEMRQAMYECFLNSRMPPQAAEDWAVETGRQTSSTAEESDTEVIEEQPCS